MSFTVLIVDDEETFRRNAEDFLTARGYETRGVGTLADARTALQRGDADVVLLDAPNYLHLAYRPGSPLVAGVWARGVRR